MKRLEEIRLWDSHARREGRAARLGGPLRAAEIARLMRGAPLDEILPSMPWREVAGLYEAQIRPRLGRSARFWDELVGAYRAYVERAA